jgi:amino acid permease
LIENSAANIKRVILTAFFIVVTIAIMFQIAIYGIIGNDIKTIAYPVIVVGNNLFACTFVGQMINSFIFIAILGACFSILTSNCWNLYTLANHNHLPLKSLLTQLNTHHVPWVSICLEGVLACLIIYITQEQISLQSISVFSQIISYTLSALAAWFAASMVNEYALGKIIPMLALGGSCYILFLSFLKIVDSGLSFSFLALFMFGIIIAIGKHILDSKISTKF